MSKGKLPKRPKGLSREIRCPWCKKGIRKDNGKECFICDGHGNYILSDDKRAK